MKPSFIRFFQAAAMLPMTLAFAAAARPAVYADIVVTHANQSFGFAGPLRYFDASESGGRIGLDLSSLGMPAFAPRPDIGPIELRSGGNRWQLIGFAGRTRLIIEATCAVESFATAETDATVQHVYLNCVDLDVSG